MMLGRFAARFASAIAISSFIAFLAAAMPLAAQDLSTGALNVTVHDPAGAVINGAQLVLKDLDTNDVHKATTSGVGTATIPYLNPAHYSLTVTRQGFSSQSYPSITIQTNRVTDLVVTLAVGAETQTVTVSGNEAPILDTTDNAISTTIDLKEVQDLPTFGRDTFALASLVPGSVGNDFNNLPGGALNTSANGFSTETNRFKSGGFDADGPSIVNRVEDVQEMTVQTSELDATHGGTSAMDIGFLTKRGTNEFHGELFWDHRNDAMNANSWYNNAVGLPRGKLIINDFGGSVGGPILKDKVFFFASLANLRQPFKSTASTTVGTAAALSGIYTTPSGGTDNVLKAGASAGCSTCTATINPLIAQDLANSEATYSQGTLTPLDANHETLNFLNKGYTVEKFPTLRLDYNLTPNFRLTGVVNESNFYNSNQGPPPYPGAAYANQAYSNVERNYQAVAGFDWDIRPTLVNAFRVGYLYTGFTYNSQGLDAPTPAMVQQGDLAFGFGLNSGVNGFNTLKGGSLYPVLSIKDDNTWAHGKHNIQFGVEAASEVDHYYNNQFVPFIGVNSISAGDPVDNALIASLGPNPSPSAVLDVEGLYATLNGRMTYYSLGQFINAKTKQFQPGISFDLHERLTQSALFLADSWRMKPTLTLNYGLRWDFAGASTDETGFYTHPDIANLWGPTSVGALFKPGDLGGVQNPSEGPHSQSYAPTYVHPQPNVGVAWNPHGGDSWLGRLMGNGKTVIRASYTFKNYTEGAQNFWNFGSNNGANFNTYFVDFPVAPSGTPPGPGFYNAGSLLLGDPIPPTLSTSPDPYNPIITEASQAFTGTSFLTFDPHIRQPYVESWEVGIQRQLSQNNVLEVRYVGNVSKNQWLGVNYNETNIFESGFLKDFQAGQANLAASGGTTFQGANPTPFFDAAFAATGAAGNYTNGQFISWLQQGQAGAFATNLAGNPSYFCSLVGAANFSPCVTAGASGTGNYPINVLQANPYAGGYNGIIEMENAGYSNYNSLQMDFRQSLNHGMQFDVNYTLAHSLDNNVQGSITPGYYGGGGNQSPLGLGGEANYVQGNSSPGFYTLRNRHLNYFPSSFDIRHVFHASGIYDFPFGHKRPFFNQNNIANAIIGGWTLGTIMTYESGTPYPLTGGTETFNQNDGGITLTGTSYSTLKHAVGVYSAGAGVPRKDILPAKYISPAGQANTSYISPNFNAGTIGDLLWLHGPKWINTDMSLTKLIPIHDQINFTLQGVFLNVFNHPEWQGMDTGVQDYTFATTSSTVTPARQIEVRGNFRF